jgi:hypothetical protein
VDLLSANKGDEQFFGLGTSIGQSLNWKLMAGPALAINLDSPIKIDSACVASLYFYHPEFTERLGALYTFGTTLDAAQASVTWTPYINMDLGNRGKYYLQPLSLSEALTLSDLPFTGGVSGSALSNSVSLSYSDLSKLGATASLSEKTRYALDSQNWEHSMSLDAAYIFAVWRQVMASVGAGASYAWGSLSAYGASNAVLGFSNDAGTGNTWGVNWGCFLGLPLGGHGDFKAFNLFTVTNLYAGLEYRGAAAFSQGENFGSGSQQAIGLEIVPVIRTMADLFKDLGLGVGISFNLTDIMKNPINTASYVPAVYINLTEASAYAALFAY